jgi:uncharacterized membrane protein YhfC
MVSTAAVIAAGVAAILDLLWPVAIFIICRRRMTLAARSILIGAGVFFVFSQVLEKALHIYLLQLNQETAAWLTGVPIRYAIYGCLAAGLFEEIGRYLAMRFLVRPTGNPGTAVAYGLGHGGIEAVLLGGLAMVQTFVLALMLNAGTLDATLGPSMAPAALARTRAALEQLSVLPVALGCLERLVTLLVQIGLSLIVWRAVEQRRASWLMLAIVLHAAVDFFAMLYQIRWMSLVTTEAIIIVIGIALAIQFVRRLPARPNTAQASGPLSPEESGAG